jgi:hypothetical protein
LSLCVVSHSLLLLLPGFKSKNDNLRHDSRREPYQITVTGHCAPT